MKNIIVIIIFLLLFQTITIYADEANLTAEEYLEMLRQNKFEVRIYTSSEEFDRYIITEEEYIKYLNTPLSKLPRKFVINNIPVLDKMNKEYGLTVPIVKIDILTYKTKKLLNAIIYILTEFSYIISLVFFTIGAFLAGLFIFNRALAFRGIIMMGSSLIVLSLVIYSGHLVNWIVVWIMN